MPMHIFRFYYTGLHKASRKDFTFSQNVASLIE